MILRVRALDFNYIEDSSVEDVTVRFEMMDNNGNYLNGNVKLTNAEYEGTDNLEDVAVIVKTKIKAKVATL